MANPNSPPTNSEFFRYMPHARSDRNAIRTSAVSFCGIGLLFCLAILAVMTRSAVLTGLQGGRGVVALLSMLIPMWAAFSWASGVIVGTSDIALENEGVRLYLLESWHVLIRWESMQTRRIMAVRSIAFHRRTEKGEEAFAVRVPGLAIPHRLAGVFYGRPFKSMFIVTPDHDSHELLMEKLRQVITSG